MATSFVIETDGRAARRPVEAADHVQAASRRHASLPIGEGVTVSWDDGARPPMRDSRFAKAESRFSERGSENGGDLRLMTRCAIPRGCVSGSDYALQDAFPA
jgi:hypothetical protein